MGTDGARAGDGRRDCGDPSSPTRTLPQPGSPALADLTHAARSALGEAYGVEPSVFGCAPARVELLGNHTDYNEGLVLAAAIDRFTIVAGRVVPERCGRVCSTGFAGTESFDVDAIDRGADGSWGRYVRGVVWALQEARGPLRAGFVAAIAGNVPLGAGLSSSASLQAALALFVGSAGLVGRSQSPALDDRSRMDLANILRRSENAFVGVQSGLLDQFSVLFGRCGSALRLDCRSLDYERLPLGAPAPAIIVCDSKTSRRLADGMYNQRRSECERVVSHFRTKRGDRAVASLRDISLDDLETAWGELDPVGRRRARHVLTENERVLRGSQLLLAGDLVGFGHLISASHTSSRDDFENSSPALDALVETAESAPGFLGGKLSGAGWAGCTVNLVESSQAEAFAERVRDGYSRRTGTVPDIHVCHAADGATGWVAGTAG
jgi:galactokinase